jgi:hypothetical protein
MEYYSINGTDGLEGMEGLEEMFSPSTLRDVAIASIVGAVTSLITGRVVNAIGESLPETLEDNTKEYVKGGIAALFGFLGGAFLHQYNKPSAFAFAGSMAGEGFAKIIRQAAGLDPALWQLRGSGMSALRATTVEVQRALQNMSSYSSQLSAPVVTQATRENGLAAVVPPRYRPYMGV